ncbi:hypothetical protein L1887_52060 [Cichorium endivia]|nr:hypothetical protein L1887_52060 [Cichorium endivia]
MPFCNRAKRGPSITDLGSIRSSRACKASLLLVNGKGPSNLRWGWALGDMLRGACCMLDGCQVPGAVRCQCRWWDASKRGARGIPERCRFQEAPRCVLNLGERGGIGRISLARRGRR